MIILLDVPEIGLREATEEEFLGLYVIFGRWPFAPESSGV